MRHPSGEDLRTIAGKEENSNFIEEDKSKWSIKIWNKEEFKKRDNVDDAEDDIVKEIEIANSTCGTSKYNEEIIRRLNWEYKYIGASFIPAKFSVSELKRRFALLDRDDSREIVTTVSLKKPSFLQKKKALSSVEKGTLMHLVMQHLDLNKVSSSVEIYEQITGLKNKEFITQVEAEAVKVDKILEFFKSDLGNRMKNSKNVYREIPFFIEIPSTEFYEELQKELYEEEKVLVQGIIDCYFEEDDKLILLDYKTDYVEEVKELKERYFVQLHYYKRALEKMTGKIVKNIYLYSFFKDEVLEM
jgi:ATP-dependent helicase/nuclease subunit A